MFARRLTPIVSSLDGVKNFEIFHRENVCYVTVAVSLKRENVECRDT